MTFAGDISIPNGHGHIPKFHDDPVCKTGFLADLLVIRFLENGSERWRSQDRFLPALATVPAAWALAYVPRFIKLGIIYGRTQRQFGHPKSEAGFRGLYNYTAC